MNILAIESSCDETAAAVVQDGRTVRSSVILSQIEMHKIYGGVVPELASRRHLEAIVPVVDEALAEAGLTRWEIDAIAVTCGPGLIGALLVGVNFAKSAAMTLGVPLIPVHHVRAHIAACYLADPELKPPFLCLCVSGGTTLIADVADYTAITVLGATRDDAAGECFDKVARTMGLGYPGGAAIDALAAGGDDTRYPLPLAQVAGHPLEFSFSGLKTAAVNLLHNAAQKGEAIDQSALAASFSRAVSDSLIPRVMTAAAQTGRHTVAAVGGVAANSRIRADLQRACTQRGMKLCLPPLALCGDNAAMVGCQGYYEYQSGNTAGANLNAKATLDLGASCAEVIM